MEYTTCRLPGGYLDENGEVHRDVILAPMSGYEEELLASNGKSSNAHLITQILTRCVRQIGPIHQVSKDMMRRLLVADRQYLILKLRENTFGERVQATIPCPWPDCGKKADIDFLLDNVPIVESHDKGPTYKMILSSDAAIQDNQGDLLSEVVFRLPNGGDQEALSSILFQNEVLALSKLLCRCIQSIGPLKNPAEEYIFGLSPLARMEIERQMEAVAPRVDLTMSVNCPECGRDFEAPFELQDFFFGELMTSQDLLYREVHYLAYHYHWSEREIMGMPRDKRRKYIEVLADEIERLNNGVN